jgi:hypothetical protein
VDYTNHRNGASRNLSQSGAVLRVYRDNRLLTTFNVPAGQGNRWNVFTISGNSLTPVETLGVHN